jgi:hypothetical protein
MFDCTRLGDGRQWQEGFNRIERGGRGEKERERGGDWGFRIGDWRLEIGIWDLWFGICGLGFD